MHLSLRPRNFEIIFVQLIGVLGFWGFGVLGFWGFGVLTLFSTRICTTSLSPQQC